MATAEEILRANGYSDEQIGQIEPRMMTAMANVLNEAANLRQVAEARVGEAQDIERRYNHMYHSEIVPALNKWGTDAANKDAENAQLRAERDFYKAQNEGARTAGFVPTDAAKFVAGATGSPQPAQPTQTRDQNGRYVAGGNPVPGSPAAFGELMRGISEAEWARDNYTRLYGEGMPEDYDFYNTLDAAAREGASFRDYVSRKYKFEEKKREIAEKKQKAHDDAIVKEAKQKWDKELAERGGANPNVRAAADSQYSRVRKAVESGQVKDPLKMTAEERRQQTTRMIRADMAERESQGNA